MNLVKERSKARKVGGISLEVNNDNGNKDEITRKEHRMRSTKRD